MITKQPTNQPTILIVLTNFRKIILKWWKYNNNAQNSAKHVIIPRYLQFSRRAKMSYVDILDSDPVWACRYIDIIISKEHTVSIFWAEAADSKFLHNVGSHVPARPHGVTNRNNNVNFVIPARHFPSETSEQLLLRHCVASGFFTWFPPRAGRQPQRHKFNYYFSPHDAGNNMEKHLFIQDPF